jgi:hypothetical protein
MNDQGKPLGLNEVGAYGELSSRPNPNGLVILSVPPFETMLPFIARRLGRELTPSEVEAERNKAPCIVVTSDAAAQMAAARAKRTGDA